MGEGSVSVSTPAPASGEPVSTAEPVAGAEIQTQATPVAADDPDIELEDGVKLKRSELRELHKKRKELDRGAYAKMQEAAAERKAAAAERAQAQEIVDEMSRDFKAAIRKAGKDPIKVAEQILQEALDEYQLSPEQKSARDQKAELERYKADEAERKAAAEAAHKEAQVANWERRYSAGFAEGFKVNGLPTDGETVERMIKKIETFAEHGIEVGKDISFIEAAALVREDMIGHGRHFFESVKDEEVETIYGDDVIERARKAALRKAQSAQTQPKVPSKAPLPRKVPGKGLTPAELRARTDRRMGQ